MAATALHGSWAARPMRASTRPNRARTGHTGAVLKTIAAQLPAPADRVAQVLRDLANYPEWLEIVRRAEPAAAHPTDPGPAWTVTLRAKVGPLARSKRLRMVRTADAADHLRFERAEIDGRDHAAWVLDARLRGDDPCEVTVELHYEGRLWSTPLEAVLGSQVDDAIPRLRSLVD